MFELRNLPQSSKQLKHGCHGAPRWDRGADPFRRTCNMSAELHPPMLVGPCPLQMGEPIAGAYRHAKGVLVQILE